MSSIKIARRKPAHFKNNSLNLTDLEFQNSVSSSINLKGLNHDPKSKPTRIIHKKSSSQNNLNLIYDHSELSKNFRYAENKNSAQSIRNSVPLNNNLNLYQKKPQNLQYTYNKNKQIQQSHVIGEKEDDRINSNNLFLKKELKTNKSNKNISSYKKLANKGLYQNSSKGEIKNLKKNISNQNYIPKNYKILSTKKNLQKDLNQKISQTLDFNPIVNDGNNLLRYN